MFTLQEIFDRVVMHLAEQGEPAMDTAGTCMYRCNMPDGRVLKCAVGSLLKDEDYVRDLEGHSYDLYEILQTYGYPVELRSDIIHLQPIHDHSKSGYEIVEGLINYARIYELNPAIIETSDIKNKWLPQ